MAWFKVDDHFPAHPRVEALEGDPTTYAAALAVWVLMGPDCAARRTDGVVSDARLRKVCAGLGALLQPGADALVSAGLWERHSDGYVYRHWERYQPTKAEIEREKQKKSERQRRWRDARLGRYQPGTGDQAVDAAVDASRDTSNDAADAPAPSHPIPIRELEISDARERACTSPARVQAPARAREGTAPRANGTGRAPLWTAERQALVFRKRYLTARQVEPNMGGRLVAQLHAQVLATARARRREPEALFVEALDAWLSRELNEREKSAPYACFAQRWGELVDSEAPGMTEEMRRLRAELDENLRIVRGEEHNAGR